MKNYFLIGDLHTAALVSKGGSIDWMCIPHFDSPSIFARVLDPHGGTFAVERGQFSCETSYVHDSAIVEHVFISVDNSTSYTMRDFMLPQELGECESHYLVRRLSGVRGEHVARFYFEPKPHYGKDRATLHKEKDFIWCMIDTHRLWLHIPDGASVTATGDGYAIDVPVSAGKHVDLVLEYSSQKKASFKGNDLEKQTLDFWKTWISRGTFVDFCREKLVRSAITLKLMQFYPTGAVIAAPTTSLPEWIGGERNWDYRYVWIRDATFSLYALYVLGYTEEAERFFSFIEETAKGCGECNGDIHLMYSIWGKHVPDEETLDHLQGYQNSRPIRIGNGAALQFQLDVYGSLIDAHYFMSKRGITLAPQSKNIILSLLKRIEERWQEPDSGIWEVRTGPFHFTYSKVMAWAGVNRAIELCHHFGLSDEQLERYRKLEKNIADWIWKECYDEKTGSFRQHPGTEEQDATNLLFVLLKFLDKRDPRTMKVIQRTCDELCLNEPFVDRYHTDDGLKGDEGAFILCTFWLVSSLAITEDTDSAERIFRAFDKYIVPHALMPEEINEENGEYLGNYPQAFSHMGYIMSAYYIHKYQSRKK